LYAESLSFNKSDGLLTGKGIISTSFTTGLSKSRIYKFTGFQNDYLEIDIDAPIVNVNGTVNFDGSFLRIPFSRQGDFRIEFCEHLQGLKNQINCNDFSLLDEYSASLKFTLRRVERNGTEYFKIVHSTSKFDAKEWEFSFSKIQKKKKKIQIFFSGKVFMSNMSAILETVMNAGFSIYKSLMIDSMQHNILKMIRDLISPVFYSNSIEDLFLKSWFLILNFMIWKQ
jgi:hypothetical protein